MIHAQFDHGSLVHLLQPENRQWHTNIVIEIARCRQIRIVTIGCPENGSDHFLDRRLAVTPRHPDNRYSELPAPVHGNFTHCQTGICDNQRRQRIIFRQSFHKHGRSPFISDIRQKPVCIEIFTIQGNKQIARPYLATVR